MAGLAAPGRASVADTERVPGGSNVSVSGSWLREWLWFVAWLFVGGAFTVGMLGALTICVFVMPAAVIAAVVLVRVHRPRGELLGLISGLGVPLLYVGYLNRGGPGDVCTTGRDGSQSCIEEWNPWPWLAVGALLVLIGVIAFARYRGTTPRA
jgi:hypothetical protein